MAVQRVHRASYTMDVAAPAGVVYGLVADTTQWPLFVPASIHVERLDFDGVHDRFHMWATANGTVRSWLSRRTLDATRHRIDFRHELPAAPTTAMGGSWTVEPRGPGRCRLLLEHDFTVDGDRAADAAWVRRATDTNSRAELAQLKETAEQWSRLDDLLLTFEDSVRIDGPADLVYAFLYDVADWPRLLPHVSRLDVREDEPGVQLMAMDTLTADGSVHTTESVRVCFPHAGRIVYKQTTTPALMAAHTGEWSVIPDETGVTAVSQHSVLLREEAVERVLGPGTTVAQARQYVREALGRNSTATLALAKQHAETAVRML
ncbi:aromatase/cyclase [Streptomyces globosus]|uniref:aromatase/cyclase n=2 Tax=Streptomyces TaxID=1883 RepID=UPI000F747EC9|nr:aromatase/cyclase [Streptomyces sp. WAC05292]RSS84350.1 cyclase [Streptomyces sp. WAC05292]